MPASATAIRRIMRELTELKKNPPEGIRIQTNEEDMLDVTGIIQGPEGTPYAGGYFKVKFKFTEEFPAAPPKCWFATKIFHPNVSGAGEICVNTLKKDWKSTYGIEHILVTVKCLLIYPNPESALDEEAGKLLLEDYASYCSRAKLITSVHATPRTRPVEFETPAASSSSKESAPSTSASTQPSSSTPAVNPVLLSPPLSSAGPTSAFNLPIGTKPVSSSSTKTPTCGDKETTTKERHLSPAPLGTADSNVTSVKSPAQAPATTTTATKAVKRAATGSAASGAEKRKKALKRL